MSVVAVGVGLAGAVSSSSASKKASKAQGNASREASASQLAASRESNALQREMYYQNRRDSAPWVNTGEGALNQLAWKMGIRPTGTVNGGKSRDDFYNEMAGQYTTTVNDPAQAQGKRKKKGFFKRALSLNPREHLDPMGLLGGRGGKGPGSRQVIDTAGLNSAADKAFAAYQAAQEAGRYKGDESDFGSLDRDFTMADRDADPVYQSGLQFGLDQGTQGIERQGAASGMQLSGATLKALARYGNDYGTTKAQGAYERFGTNQGNRFNRLSAIAGTGQQQVNQIGQAGQNYASQVGNNTINTANQVASNTIGAGNARAGGYMATANAFNNAIGTGINTYNQNRYLANMNQNNLSSGGGYQPTNYNNLFANQRLGNG